MTKKENKILLVIDVQPEFKDSKGKYQKCINYISKHREEYTKIIATMFVNDVRKNNLFIKKLKYKECKNSQVEDLEFKPDYTIKKFGYGVGIPLFGKNDKVEIIGCNIDSCVLAICFELWDAGIDFSILKNLVYTTNKNYDWKEVENIFIRNFGNCFI